MKAVSGNAGALCRPLIVPCSGVQRLGVGEWFTARVSACGVFHIVYPAASEPVRSELRTLFGQLSHDDMPMVRRSAASNIGKFAATVEPQYLKTDILSFFKDLTNDGEHYRPNRPNAKLP